MEKSIKEWKEIHQPFELDYHTNHGVNWCSDEEQFEEFWKEIREFVNPKGTILDIGCGPRPPFWGSDCVDPLLDEYKKITPPDWWLGHKTYSQPAEVLLKKKYDTVVAWNCLDHTPMWREIINNVTKYLDEKGIFILATDFHVPCVGHPGFPRDEFLSFVDERFETIDKRENFRERQLVLKLKKK